MSSIGRARSVLRNPFEQQLEIGTLDPVTSHDETDQRILDQLGERALRDNDVHDISPGSTAPQPIHFSQAVANQLR
jgi:hypothetical protein